MSSLPGKASEWPSPVLTGDPCGLPLLCAVRGPGKPSQAARRVPADHEIRYPAAQCGEARGLSPRGDVGLPGHDNIHSFQGLKSGYLCGSLFYLPHVV